MVQLIDILNFPCGEIGLHSEFYNGSGRKVSNEIDVQDLEELDGVVRGVFEAIYVLAKVIAPLR